MEIVESERYFEDHDIQLRCRLYGYCPVQGEGTIRGVKLYFWARQDNWTFAIANAEYDDPVDISTLEYGFYREGHYGQPKKYEASYMNYEDAETIIRQCVHEYISSNAE